MGTSVQEESSARKIIREEKIMKSKTKMVISGPLMKKEMSPK